MLTIKEYVKAQSLEEAWELNQKRTNRILGGMLWMKMGDVRIQKAIDLTGLGLDRIEETDEEFRIGCMVTLREIELHPGLNELSCGTVRESVGSIVGVQFRNLATVGGSIYGRFGFSDVLTAFMGLDTYVELYKGGMVPLQEFAKMPKDNDILVYIIVKKTPGRHVYLSHRNTKTDFPVLAVALTCSEQGAGVVAGARPGRAIYVPFPDSAAERLCQGIPARWRPGALPNVGGQAIPGENGEQGAFRGGSEAGIFSDSEIRMLAKKTAARIPMGSNMRASAEYRSHLAEVLIRRGLTALAAPKADAGGVIPKPESERMPWLAAPQTVDAGGSPVPCGSGAGEQPAIADGHPAGKEAKR